MRGVLQRIGEALAGFLTRPRPEARAPAVAGDVDWRRELRPCDVLLVDGSSKVSAAIRYLTQSTWSHSALCVGDAFGDGRCMLVEADMRDGIVAVPVSRYAHHNVRICRPVGLEAADLERVMAYAIGALGLQYDLRNVLDLARWLLPEPPVPRRFRRRLLTLGSGEPTRAICSTLIARAFQEVGYPILPQIHEEASARPRFRPRHHSFITPRDFDLSPYFSIVKPTLSPDFDYRRFPWHPETRVVPSQPPADPEQDQ